MWCGGTKCSCVFSPNLCAIYSKGQQFTVALRQHRTYGLLGTVSSGRPPRLSHSSQLCLQGKFKFNVALRPQRPYGLLGTPTFTQLLSSFPRRVLTMPMFCIERARGRRTLRVVARWSVLTRNVSADATAGAYLSSRAEAACAARLR